MMTRLAHKRISSLIVLVAVVFGSVAMAFDGMQFSAPASSGMTVIDLGASSLQGRSLVLGASYATDHVKITGQNTAPMSEPVIYIEENFAGTVILSDVTVDNAGNDGGYGILSNVTRDDDSPLTIILEGENVVRGGDGQSAITLGSNSKFNVIEGSGSLAAYGGVRTADPFDSGSGSAFVDSIGIGIDVESNLILQGSARITATGGKTDLKTPYSLQPPHGLKVEKTLYMRDKATIELAESGHVLSDDEYLDDCIGNGINIGNLFMEGSPSILTVNSQGGGNDDRMVIHGVGEVNGGSLRTVPNMMDESNPTLINSKGQPLYQLPVRVDSISDEPFALEIDYGAWGEADPEDEDSAPDLYRAATSGNGEAWVWLPAGEGSVRVTARGSLNLGDYAYSLPLEGENTGLTVDADAVVERMPSLSHDYLELAVGEQVPVQLDFGKTLLGARRLSAGALLPRPVGLEYVSLVSDSENSRFLITGVKPGTAVITVNYYDHNYTTKDDLSNTAIVKTCELTIVVAGGYDPSDVFQPQPIAPGNNGGSGEHPSYSFLPSMTLSTTGGSDSDTSSGTGKKSGDQSDMRDKDIDRTEGTLSQAAVGSTSLLTKWMGAEELKSLADAVRNGGASILVSTKGVGSYGIKKENLSVLTGLGLEHTTLIGEEAQVRLVIPSPSTVGADLSLSGHVTGAAVDKAKQRVQKWFSNSFALVLLEHQGSFGQTVRVTAKLDLTEWDLSQLVVYSYDRTANHYRLIPSPDLSLDQQGYVQLSTDTGGDIVISNGPLTYK